MNNYVTVALAFTDQHARSGGAAPPNLVAAAIFHARRDSTAHWTFSLTTGSASTPVDEAEAMTTFADALPWPSVLIARSPQTSIYAPLLLAAEAAPEPLRFHVVSRMARAFGGIIVDLDAGGSTKRRSTGSQNPEVLRNVARREVVDNWFEFLQRARGDNAEAAQVATNAWLVDGGGR